MGAVWRKLTGERVEYKPYQEVAAHISIPQADFRRAVQFIAPNGHRASAAEASFLTLSYARSKGFWLALYRRLPGFAAVSEWVYAFIAAHRPAFFRISKLMWGADKLSALTCDASTHLRDAQKLRIASKYPPA